MNDTMERDDGFSRFLEQSGRPATLRERALGRLMRTVPEPIRRRLSRNPEAAIDARIARFAETQKDVVFVQIGSCDGKAGDPLRAHVLERQWRGIVVEPVPGNFERLRKNYSDCPGVVCRNAALAAEAGTCTFYCVDAPAGVTLPEWTREIGSLDRNHLVKHARGLLPEVEQYITPIEVPCVDFNTLLEDADLERIDLLHTDVEGFDLEVLKQVDFTRWRPKLVLFEVFHMTQPERTEALGLLRNAGYEIVEGDMNVLAVRQD